MNIFMIGSSSSFAQSIISFLKEEHDVFQFGRKNLNYKNRQLLEKEFSKYPKPDVVIFNQQCATEDYIDHSQQIPEKITASINNLVEDFIISKLYIYDILKDANKFVFITSSITKWYDEQSVDVGKNKFFYRMFRAAEKEILKCICIEGVNAYGLCPGGLDHDPERYAKTVAKMSVSQDKGLHGKVHLVGDHI
jgi:hypothetical protein